MTPSIRSAGCVRWPTWLRMGAARALLQPRYRRSGLRDQPALFRRPQALHGSVRRTGHVFEYYADAILFGGLGFAMPSVIARDLRAYRALGIRSVSCLTFGAFSVFAYPVNLIAFTRLAVDPDEDPEALLDDSLAQRHPACRSEMAPAYRAVQRASALTLTYGEVLRPYKTPTQPRRSDLQKAAAQLRIAVEVAGSVLARHSDPLVEAERKLWTYGMETLAGLDEYLAATEAWPTSLARPVRSGCAPHRAATDARNSKRHQGHLGNLRPRTFPFDLDGATPRPPPSPAGRLQLLNWRFQGTLKAEFYIPGSHPPAETESDPLVGNIPPQALPSYLDEATPRTPANTESELQHPN